MTALLLAGVLTFAFYQGGYEDREGGQQVSDYYVTGWFTTNTGSGVIGYSALAEPSCTAPSCPMLDYHMSFHTNTGTVVFSMDGLSAFGLPFDADDTFNSAFGFFIDLSRPTVPWGHYGPPGCDPFIEGRECATAPLGFISSHSSHADLSDRINWRAGFEPSLNSLWCSDAPFSMNDHAGPTTICGWVGNHGGASLVTTERIRIWQVPEPTSLTLIGIELVGIALIRRRAMSIATSGIRNHSDT